MRLLRVLCALAMTIPSFCAATRADELPYDARVAVPVADLRREPSEPGPARDHDPLEESQLLYGEQVRVLEEKDGWACVEAVEQQEWTHHRKWEGYPGWIRLSDLVPRRPRVTPEGGPAARSVSEDGGSTRRRQDPRPTELRAGIIQSAREFLGTPYYWGGRSPYDPKAKIPPHRGVDCSGLVGLAYRAGGVTLPRDAHEQWMKARSIARNHLQPADLVFFSDTKNPKKITHVMLYIGNGRVIEGPGTGERVRETSLANREREAQVSGRKIYYGTYFSDQGSTSSP